MPPRPARMSILVTIVLAALPIIAARQCGLDIWLTITYAMAMSTVTFFLYARDKHCAEASQWRIPELSLHLLELLGGWPGAFLAQRLLRHKCAKISYQVVFWLIVLAYQLAAYDSFHHWQYSRAALDWIQRTNIHQK